MSPDGTKVYVANYGSNTVTPISTSTDTAGAPIAVGTGPMYVAFAPDGTKAYATNFGSNNVTPITTASDTAGVAFTTGSGPRGVAFTPDGTKAYVANFFDNTVTPVTTATSTPGTAIPVGTNPQAVAISPDGSKLYVTNWSDGTVTPITTTNTAGTGIPSAGGPYGGALVPDQAPTAALAAINSGEAMTPVGFDATASSDSSGTIATYTFDFGDGSPLLTQAGPTTTHTYAHDGTFAASVTVTDTVGTSTTAVFTGQTMSRNGKATARAARTVTISTPFSVTNAGGLNFAGTLTGANQTLTTTMPLNVSSGLASGWSIAATSTQWNDGGSQVLPPTATTVSDAPIVTCDVLSQCNLAASSVGYPYVLPAGATAPAASRLFNATAGTGIGRQTVTPTLRLSVPGNSYAGTYHSTITVTLQSGP